jgi:hypothetical protein
LHNLKNKIELWEKRGIIIFCDKSVIIDSKCLMKVTINVGVFQSIDSKEQKERKKGKRCDA